MIRQNKSHTTSVSGRLITPVTARPISNIATSGVSPFLLSPHNPDTIYTGGEAVWKSTDQGHSWKEISGDLTRNDKSKQKPSGGPIQNDITSIEYYDVVFALTESPLQKGMLWAGTDDGLLWVTNDDGGHWNKITPPMPEWSCVSLIDASTFDPAEAFVAVDRHRLDDFKPYIYKTTNTGQSWTAIANGIPDGAYVHAVRQDPKRRGLLYAGTELGVYISFDAGAYWQPLQMNLPTTPIRDLVVKDDDLVVATHGRAFWVLDDITPLRQINAQTEQTDMTLYQPATAVRLHYFGEVPIREPAGKNPPPGAIIDYRFKTAPKDEVTLDVLDAQGQVVRHLSSKESKEEAQPPEWPDQPQPVKTIPAEAGMNRFAWDLRYDDPVQTPGAFYAGEPPQGPVVPPGDYQLKLTVNGRTQTAPLHVVIDPREQDAGPAIAQSVALGLQVRDRISLLHQAINEIRETKAQIDGLKRRFAENERVKPALATAAELERKADAIEGVLMQVQMKSSEGNLVYPNELNEEWYAFNGTIDSDSAPTAPQQQVFQKLSRRLDGQLAAWSDLKKNEVPKVNQIIQQADVPALTVAR